MSDKLRLELGCVTKAVGLKGEFKLLLSDDYWPGILASKHLILVGPDHTCDVKVIGARPAGYCVILKVEGVSDRNEAEELRESVLVFEAEEFDVPGPEEVRPFQVVGHEVRLADGDRLGKVTDLELLPAQPLLVVRGEEREYRIPFVAPIVREWNDEEAWIAIDPPPGLLEI